jgi:hypothetical protein
MSKSDSSWTLDNVIKTLEGSPVIIWIPKNTHPGALVHWGQKGSIKRRAVCPGGFNLRSLNPKICPICAYIVMNGAAGRNEDGWKAKRQFYVPALEGEMSSGGIVTFPDTTVKLLSSTDGFGIKLFRAIEAAVKSKVGGASPDENQPFGYSLEITRAGGNTDVTFSVQKIAGSQCEFPKMDDLEDPEDLLGKGLLKFIEPTPVEVCKQLLTFEKKVVSSVSSESAEQPRGEKIQKETSREASIDEDSIDVESIFR